MYAHRPALPQFSPAPALLPAQRACQLSWPIDPLQGTTVQTPGLGPIFSTALRGVNAVSAKLTDVALQARPCSPLPPC